MPKRIAFAFLAIIFLPFGISGLAEDRPANAPPCLPSSLDVYALPPANSSPVPVHHLLVFEVRNIGKVACSLDSPVIQLVPALSGHDEFDSIKYLPDGRSTQGRFDETVLSPGDWVHTLVMWHSQGYPNSQCVEHSGMNLRLMHEDRGIQPVKKTSVEVRNLQMRSCILVFVSTGLTADYDLPPGEYTVRPHQRGREPEDVCKPQKEQPFSAVPGNDLTFSVVQP
jgi:hypothetical protein